MKLLEEKIQRDGVVIGTDILKVDSFLNHQMDVSLFQEMGKEWKRLYEDAGVNKILTIEASGIGMACIAALEFGCPVVFAKKGRSRNISNEFYTAKVISFTHGGVNDILVAKAYLKPGDRVLIIDDFLASGEALNGLISIVNRSGATLVGAGIAIEKTFQQGGAEIRSRGIRIESLAKIRSMDEQSGIVFDE